MKICSDKFIQISKLHKFNFNLIKYNQNKYRNDNVSIDNKNAKNIGEKIKKQSH